MNLSKKNDLIYHIYIYYKLMEKKPVDNSLPTHLKMYIEEENLKYFKENSISSSTDIMDNMTLIKLQEFKEALSYWYSELNTFKKYTI